MTRNSLSPIPRCIASVILLGLSVVATVANAQHPVDVQRKVADGDYMAALRLFDKMPKRTATVESRIAAARSAWALSLPQRAMEEFDRALEDPTLSAVDRARIHLSKGIIELQENRPQLAAVQAEKGIAILTEAGPLRAQLFALAGEARIALRNFAKAEESFTNAIEECSTEQRTEIEFFLGKTQYELGRFEDARQHFESVPLRHERAPEAIRYLAKGAIEQNDLSTAVFWLTKGRSDYPDLFLDSWVDYVLVRAAIAENNFEQASALYADAQKRLPPSDPWLVMIAALQEESTWKSSVQGGEQ